MIRLTADYSDKVAKIEFVVADDISLKGSDNYEDAATEFLSYFDYDSDLDVKIIKVKRGTELPKQSLSEDVFHCDESLFR